MASLCSKPTGLARLPGGEGGDLSVNCRPACHATGYLLLKQGRYIRGFMKMGSKKSLPVYVYGEFRTER